MKYAYQIDYRYDGQWIPFLSPYPTKKQAEDAASVSMSCQRHGYQIRRVRVKR